MRLVRILRHFAAIKIGSEGHVALLCKSLGLIANPIVEAPPLLNHDDRGMFPFALGRDEISGAFTGHRGEGHGFSRLRGKGRRSREQRNEDQQRKASHRSLLSKAATILPLRPLAKSAND